MCFEIDGFRWTIMVSGRKAMKIVSPLLAFIRYDWFAQVLESCVLVVYRDF